MSKITMAPNASGTGTFTIASPNSNSDRTLTLPDNTGTVLTDSSGVLNIGSGQIYKDSSGNVGIGTSSPGKMLTVGPGGTGTTGAYYARINGGSGASGWFGMDFASNGTTKAGIYYDVNSSTLNFANTVDPAMRIDSSGNLLFNSGYGSVATAYGCRAWVNFNGTGTVAIRASGNVSSITDNGTGDYTVNFTTAMPDANYSAVANSDSTNSSGPQGMVINFSTAINNKVAPTSSALRISCWVLGTGGGFDNSYINVSIFR